MCGAWPDTLTPTLRKQTATGSECVDVGWFWVMWPHTVLAIKASSIHFLLLFPLLLLFCLWSFHLCVCAPVLFGLVCLFCGLVVFRGELDEAFNVFVLFFSEASRRQPTTFTSPTPPTHPPPPTYLPSCISTLSSLSLSLSSNCDLTRIKWGGRAGAGGQKKDGWFVVTTTANFKCAAVLLG